MENGIVSVNADGVRVVLADMTADERAKGLTRSEISVEVAGALDGMRAVDPVIERLPETDVITQEDAHTLLTAYGDIRDAASDMAAYRDRIKAAAKAWLESHPDADSIEDRISLTRFTLSKRSVSVSYDEEAIKTDRPDVWKKVAKRYGKRMKVAERREVESRIAELKAELAQLNARLVEDDAARTERFDADLFEAQAAQDSALGQYRHETVAPRKFYYRNSDDFKDFV